MYGGHFAVSCIISALFPNLNPLYVAISTSFLDIINSLFIMLGISVATPDCSAGPYIFFSLDFIDWDHSLAAAIFWSFLIGFVLTGKSKDKIIYTFTSLTHFGLDLIVHNQDLALYPYSEIKLGFSLWSKWGVYSWLLEVFIVLTSVLFSLFVRSRQNRHIPIMAYLLILFLPIQMSPWLSPTRYTCNMDYFKNESFYHGLTTLMGCILPCLVIAYSYSETGISIYKRTKTT